AVQVQHTRLARTRPADVDDAPARHSRIAVPLPRTDGQSLGSVIPPARNARILAVQILAAGTVVLVEREAAVRAGVHIERDRRMRVVAGMLDGRADRNNRACAYEQR